MSQHAELYPLFYYDQFYGIDWRGILCGVNTISVQFDAILRIVRPGGYLRFLLSTIQNNRTVC